MDKDPPCLSSNPDRSISVWHIIRQVKDLRLSYRLDRDVRIKRGLRARSQFARYRKLIAFKEIGDGL
jgi:hypothetical protein